MPKRVNRKQVRGTDKNSSQKRRPIANPRRKASKTGSRNGPVTSPIPAPSLAEGAVQPPADLKRPAEDVREISETLLPTETAENSGVSLPEASSRPAVSSEARESDKKTGDEAPVSDEVLELLAFKLADEEYAVDILLIREIIRLVEITRVPRRPAFVKGIISLRGTIIPILDLRVRLGLTEAISGRAARILVVGLKAGLVGVIADSVTEVVKIGARDIDPPPVTGGQSSSHLMGVTRVNGRLLILLDLEKAVELQ